MGGPRVLVDRYTLTRQLGAGAQGTVWLARDEKLRREVAVKQVSHTDQRFGEAAEIARQRALREGRIAARLNHPNAVSVYDVAVHDGDPWLVMEYVPSRTLTEVVREQGGIPPRQAAALGAQIAGALAEAHRLSIVHRDVKPSNILITVDGRAKITDFGIARGMDDATLTATGLVTGTPAYFAPELARGVTGPTPATDVWSLGATLYYAVEGMPPFGTDENPLVLLGRIASQEVQRPVHAGELEHVLLRMLSRDPAMRPTMRQSRAMLSTIAGEVSNVPVLIAEPNTEENDRVTDHAEKTKVVEQPAAGSSTKEDAGAGLPAAAGAAAAGAGVGAAGSEAAEAEDADAADADAADAGVADAEPDVEEPEAEPAAGSGEEVAGGRPESGEVATTAGDTDPEAGEPEGEPAETPDNAEAAGWAAAAGSPAGPGEGDQPDEISGGSTAEAVDEPRYEPPYEPTKASDELLPDPSSDEPAGALAAPYEPVADMAAPPPPPGGYAPGTGRFDDPPLPDPRRERQRKRGIVLIAACAIMLAIAGLGSYLLLGNGDDNLNAASPEDTAQNTPAKPKATPKESRPQQTPTTEPTPTNTPKPTTPPPTTPAGSPMQADRMTAFVSDYYDLLPDNHQEAWNWLGPELKAQGFASYTKWWSSVRDVSVGNLRANPSSKTVTGTVRFVMNSGRVATERYTFGLIETADGKGLLINTDD